MSRRRNRRWSGARYPIFPALFLIILCFCNFRATVVAEEESEADKRFERIAARFVDGFSEFSPVSATSLGDHRYDDQLDQASAESRRKELAFCERLQAEARQLDRSKLSRQNQVDFQLLSRYLAKKKWRLTRLEEWAWNPVMYTQLCGGSVYGLMSREFAPLPKRLNHVAVRLEQLPRLLKQVRSTLQPSRVPTVHAETALKQNRGVLSMLDNMVKPHLDKLNAKDRSRLEKAISVATTAVIKHESWLQEELVPNANGDFRIGLKRYEEKLAYSLETKLTRQQIRDMARSELKRVRAEMYDISRGVLKKEQPDSKWPKRPTAKQQQDAIKAALELAYADAPERDQVLASARKSMKVAEDFIRDRDLISIPNDPLEIIVMPEFQRGVSVAYCDSPGPLEVGQKTFYAVAPLPEKWTDEQCESFLREYNIRSIHNLTVHEAMPGHFLQLAFANRYPGKLRAVTASGVFIEGWACYTEQMLSEEGFLDRDPLMRLITLKWYLRSIANTILDQSLHVEGMTRSAAMKLMIEDTFQQEREAAGKWTRAQLTSVQLSTYFVGFHEHQAMRRAAEESWGDKFKLKDYHDRAVSFGSPPVRFARALLLNQPIPE